jgi:hypothetical protein
LRRALAHHLVPDVEGPANYSVILSSGGRNKKIEQVSLLYRSSQLVVRSRTPSRVLHGLFSYLSGHLEIPEGLLTHAVVAVSDGQAVLMPPVVRGSLKLLQPHLRRVRWQLADAPFCIVDAESGEIVVPEPALTIDAAVVEEIESREASSKEVPRVVPGRYPIRGWACSGEPGDGPLSRAMAVALTLPSVDDSYLGIEGTVEALATLFSSAKAVPVSVGKPKEMVNDLRAALRL